MVSAFGWMDVGIAQGDDHADTVLCQDLMVYSQVGIDDLDMYVDEANRVHRHGGRLEGT